MSSRPQGRALSRAEVLVKLREHLPRLRDYGVVGMGVFGETARDALGPDDWIEVTVDIDPARKHGFSLLDQGAIHADLSEAFGRFVRVIVDAKGSDPGLTEQIVRERVDV